jgi:hypothetical protein
MGRNIQDSNMYLGMQNLCSSCLHSFLGGTWFVSVVLELVRWYSGITLIHGLIHGANVAVPRH